MRKHIFICAHLLWASSPITCSHLHNQNVQPTQRNTTPDVRLLFLVAFTLGNPVRRFCNQKRNEAAGWIYHKRQMLSTTNKCISYGIAIAITTQRTTLQTTFKWVHIVCVVQCTHTYDRQAIRFQIVFGYRSALPGIDMVDAHCQRAQNRGPPEDRARACSQPYGLSWVYTVHCTLYMRSIVG